MLLKSISLSSNHFADSILGIDFETMLHKSLDTEMATNDEERFMQTEQTKIRRDIDNINAEISITSNQLNVAVAEANRAKNDFEVAVRANVVNTGNLKILYRLSQSEVISLRCALNRLEGTLNRLTTLRIHLETQVFFILMRQEQRLKLKRPLVKKDSAKSLEDEKYLFT